MIQEPAHLNLTTIRSYFLIAWAISFPFWIRLSSVLVAVSFILYVVDSALQKKFVYNFKQHLPVLIFFVLILLSLLYTQDVHRGLGDLKKKLPLLLMPFSFYGIQLKYGMSIKRAFISSVLIYCFANLVYCLILFTRSNETLFIPFFQNFMISIWHPSYLTLYLLMGMVFAILDIMRGAKNNRFIIDAFTIVILGVYIYYFTARAAQICAGVLMLVVISHVLTKRLPRNVLLSLIALVILLIASGLWTGTVQKQTSHFIQSEVKAGGVRLKVWPIAIHIVEQNWMVGIGAGDVRDEIKDELIKQGDLKLANGQLNTHNQFLEVIITIGSVGMLAFLFLLVAPLCYLKNKLEYLLFLIICTVMFCFEATLNRQAGMIFFAFFYYLIIWDDDEVQLRKLFNKRMSKYFMVYVLVNISVALTVLVGFFANKHLFLNNSSPLFFIFYLCIFTAFTFSIRYIYRKLHRLLIVDNR